MLDGPLQLYWKDQHVGEITDYGWSDFPWVSGKVALRDIGQDLRQALEYLSAEAATEDGVQDWPFPEELSFNWSIVKPDGKREEICIPIIDFADGSITWR